jgi:hypothetical protein
LPPGGRYEIEERQALCDVACWPEHENQVRQYYRKGYRDGVSCVKRSNGKLIDLDEPTRRTAFTIP